MFEQLPTYVGHEGGIAAGVCIPRMRAVASCSPCLDPTMPKTLVLYQGNDDDLAALADAVADGIRSVRFAEVDVRRLQDSDGDVDSGRHRLLASADELANYDGFVLGTASGETVPESVSRFLAEAATARQHGAMSTSVGGAFRAGMTPADDDARWSLLRALGALGVVLVPSAAGDVASARQHGHRIAHVVAWITHARSHHHH